MRMVTSTSLVPGPRCRARRRKSAVVVGGGLWGQLQTSAVSNEEEGLRGLRVIEQFKVEDVMPLFL